MTMEKFINQKKPNTPTATIRKYGMISFNKIACRQFNIKKHRFVNSTLTKERERSGTN